jgi:hypothetical protein
LRIAWIDSLHSVQEMQLGVSRRELLLEGAVDLVVHDNRAFENNICLTGTVLGERPALIRCWE